MFKKTEPEYNYRVINTALRMVFEVPPKNESCSNKFEKHHVKQSQIFFFSCRIFRDFNSYCAL